MIKFKIEALLHNFCHIHLSHYDFSDNLTDYDDASYPFYHELTEDDQTLIANNLTMLTLKYSHQPSEMETLRYIKSRISI
jgi:hypothetical protein